MQLIGTFSGPLNKALGNGNSLATWATFVPSDRAPTGDGVYEAGHGGIIAPNRVFLLPYAEGTASQSFALRLYGWRGLGQPSGNPNTLVWMPFLLAEFACTLGNLPGPPCGIPGRLILETEQFCDTVALTQGFLGLTGGVCSTGPGTDLMAWAIVELQGCRYFQFDFNQVDPVGMNCLWAKA